ncbi:MAG: hypothetical protein KGH94_00650 [Candidatus Micrarchaeota archaeon]|nr:hypothetical protein [Candidatus Micrarchaeota archaeon]
MRKSNPTRSRDLLDAGAGFWFLLWGAPIVISIVGGLLNSAGLLSLTALGIVFTVCVMWIGAGCFINGKRCGRVHCKIDGVLFPLLAVVGALNIIGYVHMSWNLYWGAFFVILFASFAAEILWKCYT